MFCCKVIIKRHGSLRRTFCRCHRSHIRRFIILPFSARSYQPIASFLPYVPLTVAHSFLISPAPLLHRISPSILPSIFVKSGSSSALILLFHALPFYSPLSCPIAYVDNSPPCNLNSHPLPCVVLPTQFHSRPVQ